MFAMELPGLVEDMGGLTVPMAPVVVVIPAEDGTTRLVKLTGKASETQIGGRWVFALVGEEVGTKVEFDLD